MKPSKLWCGLVIAGMLAAAAGQVRAQEAAKPPAPAPPPPAAEKKEAAPAANPEDVKSIDAIMHAVYDCISGPAGQKRDWQRLRSLYLPGARLAPVGKQVDGSTGARVFTVDEFITHADAYFEKNSFYESEVSRQVNQYGHIAQVFSTYASRKAPGEAPFERGINGFDLVNDGTRWWVVTVFWENESAENPIPEKYLQP